MQIADELKSSHAFLDYRLCVLKLKVAYFIHEVLSACIARKCELFIIQKLSTYLSTWLTHSQNVQPFTELGTTVPADTATAPVNTTILSPIPCSDQRTPSILQQCSIIVKLNKIDKCILVSAREVPVMKN